MVQISESWKKKVLPHGPLTKVAPGVWTVEGRLRPKGQMTRTMVVYQLPDGGLWLHSVVALDPIALFELESIGEPKVLVVPNGMHRRDIAVYAERYPRARVVCPGVARAKVAEVVRVDAEDKSVCAEYGIEVLSPRGIKPLENVYGLPTSQGKVLVFTDCLMNLPRLRGLEGFVLRLIGSAGFFGLTRVGKWVLLQDAAAYRGWLEEQSNREDLKALTVGHGSAVTSDLRTAFLRAADRLR